MVIQVLDLGLAPYASALEAQRECVASVRDSGGREAFLLLVEHDPPVITLGRRGREASNVVASRESLAAAGIELVHASRGGQATYHGPGQLVGYPILDLRSAGLTVRQYVHQLEEAIILTTGRFGVPAFRREGLIGVWAPAVAWASRPCVAGPSRPCIGVPWHDQAEEDRGQDALATHGPEAHATGKLAAIGVAVERRVVYHGFALNVCTDLERFGLIVPCGRPGALATSLSQLLGRRVDIDRVRPVLIECFGAVFGATLTYALGATGAQHPCAPHHAAFPDMQSALAVLQGPRVLRTRGTQVAGAPATGAVPRLPSWLRRPAQAPARSQEVRGILSRLALSTVCTSAHCPNRGECFARGTATFLILGDRCTRACRFCAVAKGEPLPPREDEPRAVAQAAREMALSHVVITSVTRDDLPDGGAEHFARTIAAVHDALPKATIEVLTPDFQGSKVSLRIVLAARPDVFNHNVETVPRLYPLVRPQADYGRSVGLLRAANAFARGRQTAEMGTMGIMGVMRTDVSHSAHPSHDSHSRYRVARVSARPAACPPYAKSGLMLGLGETRDEVRQVLRDLRGAGCDIVTIGQYLQPTPEQQPVAEFIPPETFTELGGEAREMGFLSVAAGPFVRSSYRAERVFDSGAPTVDRDEKSDHAHSPGTRSPLARG